MISANKSLFNPSLPSVQFLQGPVHSVPEHTRWNVVWVILHLIAAISPVTSTVAPSGGSGIGHPTTVKVNRVVIDLWKNSCVWLILNKILLETFMNMTNKDFNVTFILNEVRVRINIWVISGNYYVHHIGFCFVQMSLSSTSSVTTHAQRDIHFTLMNVAIVTTTIFFSRISVSCWK